MIDAADAADKLKAMAPEKFGRYFYFSLRKRGPSHIQKFRILEENHEKAAY